MGRARVPGTQEPPGRRRREGVPCRRPGRPPDRPTRLRRFFPESILFAPLVETDAEGRARVEVATPDSVTTWRADAIAHAASADGPGGVAQAEARFRTTLPFVADCDAPTSLWAGDEAQIPIVLRWTGAARSDVVAETTAAGAVELLSPARTTLRPDARGEAAVFVRLRGVGAGTARLTVRCVSGGATDAVEREIAVRVPGVPSAAVAGFRVPTGRATVRVARPAEALPGSERLELRLFGGPLDDVLDGVAGLLATPHGCFEQASSTLFPNVLALTYLDRAGRVPEGTRRRFDDAIAEGTKLLLSYEIEGGGFDWFGRPPAKLLLSAYGAHEWWMLHRVRRSRGLEDPDGADGAGAVALRTTRWLVSQQRADGSFPAEGVPYAWRDGAPSEVAATAYVGWALTHARTYGDGFAEALAKARAFVAAKAGAGPSAVGDDPYVLALVALFLAESSPDDAALAAAQRLARHVRREGGRAWVGGGSGSTFHGRGAVASVEATALAVLAGHRIARPDLLPADELLASLARERRRDGTWGTTQATVLALWAMLDAKEEAPPEGTQVVVRAAGLPDRAVPVGGAAGAVTVDLGAMLAKPGPYEVVVERIPSGRVSGTLTLAHVVAWPRAGAGGGPVAVRAPLPNRVRVGEPFVLGVEVRNQGDQRVAMPIAVVPLPAGVSVPRAALRTLRLPEAVARVETEEGRVVVYLRRLDPGAAVTLPLPAIARLRGRLAAAPPEARPYYEPDALRRGEPATVEVE